MLIRMYPHIDKHIHTHMYTHTEIIAGAQCPL